MFDATGLFLIGEDAVFIGSVRNCRRLEVRGYVEGDVVAEHTVIVEKGRLYGTLRGGSADVHGDLQGKVHIRDLIRIASTGSVAGDVLYGQLALAAGGDLAATVRNVPPALFGDLELTVARGGTVRVETTDLTAVDPDNAASELRFTVSSIRHGFVALADAPGAPVGTFTQADIQGGRVLFAHSGDAGKSASFDVVVTDTSGAASGPPRTVTVRVVDAG